MGNAGKKLSDVITARVADEWNKSAARNDGIENRAGSIIRPGRSLKEVTGYFFHFLHEPYETPEDDPREYYPAIRRGDFVYLHSPIRDPHNETGQFPAEWIVNSSTFINVGGEYNPTTTLKPAVGSRTNPTPIDISQRQFSWSTGNYGDRAGPIRIGVALDTIPHGSAGRIQVGGLAAVRIFCTLDPGAAYWESNEIPRALPDVLHDGLKTRISRIGVGSGPSAPDDAFRWYRTIRDINQIYGLHVRPRTQGPNPYLNDSRGVDQSSFSLAGTGRLIMPEPIEYPGARSHQHYPRLVWLQNVENDQWMDVEIDDNYIYMNQWEALLWGIVNLDVTPAQSETRQHAIGDYGYVTNKSHYIGANHIENGPQHETPWPLDIFTNRLWDGPWFLDNAANVEALERLGAETRYHLRNQASHGNRNDYFAAKEKGAASGSDYRMDVLGFTPSGYGRTVSSPGETVGVPSTVPQLGYRYGNEHNLFWQHKNRAADKQQYVPSSGINDNALGSIMFCQCSINFEPFGDWYGGALRQNRFASEGYGNFYIYPATETPEGEQATNYNKEFVADSENRDFWDKMAFVGDYTFGNFFNTVEPDWGNETWGRAHIAAGKETTAIGFYAPSGAQNIPLCRVMDLQAGIIVPEDEWQNKSFQALLDAGGYSHEDFMEPIWRQIFIDRGHEWGEGLYDYQRVYRGHASNGPPIYWGTWWPGDNYPDDPYDYDSYTYYPDDWPAGNAAWYHTHISDPQHTMEARAIRAGSGNSYFRKPSTVGESAGTVILGNSFTSETGGAKLRIEGADDSNFQRLFFDAPEDGSTGDFEFVIPIRTTLAEYQFSIIENFMGADDDVPYHYAVVRYIDDDTSLGKLIEYRTFDSEIKITARVFRLGYDVELVLQQSSTVYPDPMAWHDTTIRTRRHETGAGPWSIQAAGFHRLENSFDGDFSHSYSGTDLRWAVRTRATIVGSPPDDWLSLNGFLDDQTSLSYPSFNNFGGDRNLIGISTRAEYPAQAKHERFDNAGGFQSFRGVGWGITNFGKTINNGE